LRGIARDQAPEVIGPGVVGPWLRAEHVLDDFERPPRVELVQIGGEHVRLYMKVDVFRGLSQEPVELV
jgi:hypothetical protein